MRHGIDDAGNPLAWPLNIARIHVRRLPAPLVFPITVGDAVLPVKCGQTHAVDAWAAKHKNRDTSIVSKWTSRKCWLI
jgi:hypothetical protein